MDELVFKSARREARRNKAYNAAVAGVRYDAAHAGQSLVNHVLKVDKRRKTKRRK